MSVLSREIGWRIILVSQKTLKENWKEQDGETAEADECRRKSPPHTPGNKHLSFPRKVLPTEEPLAVEAHHVPGHTQLHYVL
jgi:hypothetical protein